MPNINTYDINAKHHYFLNKSALLMNCDVNCEVSCEANRAVTFKKESNTTGEMNYDINAK